MQELTRAMQKQMNSSAVRVEENDIIIRDSHVKEPTDALSYVMERIESRENIGKPVSRILMSRRTMMKIKISDRAIAGDDFGSVNKGMQIFGITMKIVNGIEDIPLGYLETEEGDYL